MKERERGRGRVGECVCVRERVCMRAYVRACVHVCVTEGIRPKENVLRRRV